MVKVLTYDMPVYKIKLKIRQLQEMGKKIQGKLITQAMNGTSVANRIKVIPEIYVTKDIANFQKTFVTVGLGI